MSGTLAFASVLPRDGVVFFTQPENPIIEVSRDLCKMAAFFQGRDPYRKLRRFDDWWEHDALYFDKGNLDFHGLFELVGTPRSLLTSMPGDDRVFIGVEDLDRTWYLRFFADWDARDENIVGEYSVTLDRPLGTLFAKEVKPSLDCALSIDDATRYFERVKA